MMPPGVKAKKLAVQHVGETRHRVPIGRNCSVKRISHARRCNPLLHLRILGYVKIIVEIDETVASGRKEDGDDQDGKRGTKHGGPLIWREAEGASRFLAGGTIHWLAPGLRIARASIEVGASYL